MLDRADVVHVQNVMNPTALERATERGRAVALLVPLEEGASPLARLIEAGRARAPLHGVADLTRPAGEPTRELSRALEEERSEG